MTKLTATDVARDFSNVINRVRAGEDIEIVRNGEPVASLTATGRSAFVSAERWRSLVAALPAVDDAFADDVEAARASLEPEHGEWPS
jgi:prevent-host-death family protein